MRQRPVDINQTTLFIDTQPRPVNRDALVRRLKPTEAADNCDGGGSGASVGASSHGRGGGADEMSPRRAVVLAVVGTLLLAAGFFLVRGYQYGHLYRRIEQAYFGYLQEWEDRYAADFGATEWSLEVEGLPAALPLAPTRRPSKRVPVPHGAAWPPASAAAAPGGSETGGPAAAAGGGGRRRHAAAAQTTLLEFQLDHLLTKLFFRSASSLAAAPGAAAAAGVEEGEAAEAATAEAHRRLWRPVGQALRAGRAVALVAADSSSGEEIARMELGRVAFARTRSVPAGGEGRCLYEQRGTWEPDSTCTVHEYLAALCVKVARIRRIQPDPDSGSGSGSPGSTSSDESGSGSGPPGPYALDSSLGGGPGCGAEVGWEAAQWRRLDVSRHSLHGQMYLPLSARNATTVVVRHSHDPSILEAEAVRQLAPNMEQQILMHAVGLALCFLGCVLLLSVAAFQSQQLLAAARAVLRLPLLARRGKGRRRGGGGGGRGGKHSDDERLPEVAY